MFKSVFTKYMTTFTLIILFSFAILIMVIYSIISNYTIDSKQKTMDKSAEVTVTSIETFINNTDEKNFEVVSKKYANSIHANLVTIAELAKSDIYLIDINGDLINCSKSSICQTDFISSKALNNILANQKAYMISNVEGTFDRLMLNYFGIIELNGAPSAIVMVSSPDIGDGELSSTLIKTIISVSLWIFLAALISVYFISERIVDPLRQISTAAKNFAKGKFEERIRVIGRDEVALLAESFNNMAESLGRLEQMRSSFLANVSHDLRTPMTTISGFVDGILDGTIPEEKHSYYLSIISSEVRRLSRLVSSLLQLSRMEAGETKLKLSDFNLSEKARQILISFENKIDNKNIEIEFINEQDIYVNADSDAIHQVIYNLTDNAIKFTPEGGSISISLTIRALEKRSKKAVFSIKNSGPGIPPDEVPFIFERCYKSDRSRGLDKTGTGLGLYIAKSTLISHDEDIKVVSEPGKFTEFDFTLPFVEKHHGEKNK